MSRVARSTVAPVAHDATADMAARIAALEAENAALKAAKSGRITMKVAKGGGLSLYGMQRWPITLYVPQWRRLAAVMSQIIAFCDDEANYLPAGVEWSEGCGKLSRGDG